MMKAKANDLYLMVSSTQASLAVLVARLVRSLEIFRATNTDTSRKMHDL